MRREAWNWPTFGWTPRNQPCLEFETLDGEGAITNRQVYMRIRYSTRRGGLGYGGWLSLQKTGEYSCHYNERAASSRHNETATPRRPAATGRGVFAR